VSWKPLRMTKQEESSLRRAYYKKARFLIDEQLDTDIAPVLKEMGWNVETAAEAGLSGRSDEDVLAYAWRTNRILITGDSDFKEERRFPSFRNPGIVIVPSGTDSYAAVATAVFHVGEYRELYRGDVIEVDRAQTITVRSTDKTGKRSSSRFRFTKTEFPNEWVG
jgi:predicted nuclease of predicted toxin-antitoxin system